MRCLNETFILTALATLAFTACQQTPDAAHEFDVSLVEFGQDIAKTHCTVCHTIKASGESPRTDAPPLRTVLSNYNPNALADDFREHIHVGHADMPEFNFTVKETEGLLAYLDSIQK